MSRADDLGETLLRFADTAIAEKVDLALLPGDLFHTRRPLPRDLLYLARTLNKLREASILTLISGGNHDGPDTVGDERTHALAWMTALSLPGVRMFTNAKATTIKMPDGRGFNIVATPYPHKRSFDAVMPDADPEERIEAISRAYESAVDTLIDSVQSKNDLPTLFMGHVSVVGASLGSETTMRFGWDVTARSGLFDKVDYAALGHIHRQQQIGDRAWYAGSAEYHDFGEEGQTKGFLLVEFNKGKRPKVEVIDSKPRAMLSVELHESESGWSASVDDIPEGAIVRLTIYPLVSVAPQDVLKMVRQYRSAGASHVSYKVNLPEKTAGPRAHLSAEAEVADALKAWLTAGGHDLEPALTAGIEMVNSLGADG